MATLLGSLLIRLGLDSADFTAGLSVSEKELKASTRRIEKIGKSMSDLGGKLSLAVTAPLAALAASSIKAAMESKDALGQVDAALKSMGSTAGRTSAQLEGLASGIMRKSLFDDDEILRSVTANLLTFGNVAEAEFDRAQQAAVDLSARMGTDLQASAILVGKALNDPVKGLTALSRAGIQFTDQQKEQIKAMAAAGDAAGAQRIMLAELERQFKGSAEAARAADPFAAMQQGFAEFQETIGGELLKALPAITGAIEKVLAAFNTLSPGMQQAAIIGGALAAALGPVLMGLGAIVSAAAPFIAAIGAIGASGGVLMAMQAAVWGLVAAFGPVLAPIAAFVGAGALIYANWGKIAPVLAEVWQQIVTTLGPPLAALASSAKAAFDEIVGSELVQNLIAFAQVVGNVGLVLLKAFGGAIPGIVRALGGVVVAAIQIIIDAIRIVVNLLSGDWAGAWQAAKDLAGHFAQGFMALFGGLAQAVIGFIGGMVQGIKDWLGNKLDAVWKWVGDKIDWVKGKFHDLADAVVFNSYIPDMVDGIAAHMARLDSVMVDKAVKTTEKTKAAFKKLADDLRPLLDRLIPEARALIDYRNDLATIDKGQAAGAIDAGTADLARRRLGGLGDDPNAVTALPELDPIVPALDKIDEALGGLKNKAQIATVAIAKSFKDMADETIGALQRVASAVKGGGFLDILSAVIGLGTQLASIGAFGKSIQAKVNAPVGTPPIAGARALGGPVSGGRTYLVGERGPELFTPGRNGGITSNRNLRAMGGSSQIQVVPSPYFNVVVDGRIVGASPSIMDGGARIAASRGARAQSRRLA